VVVVVLATGTQSPRECCGPPSWRRIP